MVQPRPPSPFLALLLTASTAALVTEWLRFQWGWPAAIPPAVLGFAATFWITGRAYVARRAWRLRRQRWAEVGWRLTPAPAVHEADGWSVHARDRRESTAASARPADGAERSEAPPGRPAGGRPEPGEIAGDVGDTVARR